MKLFPDTYEGPDGKKTFMQWVKVRPVWYVVFGVLCIFAAIYSIFKPTFFMGDGMFSYVVTVAVFFCLGFVLIWQGIKLLQAKKQQ